MKVIKLFFPLFICFCLVACSGNKQDYNLNFRNTDRSDFKWNASAKLFAEIDSNEIVNGKYPVLFNQNQDSTSFGLPLHTLLYQQIPLPSGLSEDAPVFISVRAKQLNVSQSRFQLYTLDKYDNIIYSDTLSLNNDNDWIKRSLMFPVENADKIVIGLYALGYEPSSVNNTLFPQKFWLDRINLTVNGKSIEKYSSNTAVSKTNINKENVKELVPENKGDLIKIIPENKRVIGIGKSVERSKKLDHIQLNWIKGLIESHNCKLIIFDMDMCAMYVGNLYALGVMEEDYLDKIEKKAGSYLSEETISFLKWLRNYNQSTDNKVVIQGMVGENYDASLNPLFDYISAFYNSQSASIITPLLSLVNKKETLPEAFNFASKSQELKQIMGIDFYSDLLYGLQQTNKFLRGNQYDYTVKFHRSLSYDYTIYQQVERCINQYIKEGEKTVILAPSSYLDKKGDIRLFPYIYTTGYYLDWKYKEHYYALSFHVEEESPRENSLEHQSSIFDLPCFYYSSSKMTDGNILYRSMREKNSQEYNYNYFPSHFDGFIFINEFY